MNLLWFLGAVAAGAMFAVFTKQKGLAIGLVLMGIFTLPAAISEWRTGDFWMGESLLAGFGLLLGTVVICVGELRTH
jgi:hypothetical protein